MSVFVYFRAESECEREREKERNKVRERERERERKSVRVRHVEDAKGSIIVVVLARMENTLVRTYVGRRFK